jgi:hypothetical protein
VTGLSLQTQDERTVYRPGETVAGVASWELPEAPRAVEVRLFWYTEGKGTQDVEVVDSVRFESPPAAHQEAFELTLGEGPFSFSGKLISLLWAIELVVQHPNDAARLDLVVSPTGREVLLHGSDAT